MKHIFILILTFMLVLPAAAQQEAPNIRRGNRDYKNEQYTEAELDYRRGLEKNNRSFQGHYNLGNALMRQDKYQEATEQYALALQQLDEKKEQMKAAQTYHNLGNALYAQEQYDKSVAAYQRSLRLNPKDDETRYNLVKAMQMLQQQQQQQQDQDDQQQQQQQQQQDQQQQQQNEDQQENQDDQEQQQQPQPDDQQMDKEQAEQILQALQQDEQDTQDKAKRQQMQSKFRTDKDW